MCYHSLHWHMLVNEAPVLYRIESLLLSLTFKKCLIDIAFYAEISWEMTFTSKPWKRKDTLSYRAPNSVAKGRHICYHIPQGPKNFNNGLQWVSKLKLVRNYKNFAEFELEISTNNVVYVLRKMQFTVCYIIHRSLTIIFYFEKKKKKTKKNNNTKQNMVSPLLLKLIINMVLHITSLDKIYHHVFGKIVSKHMASQMW